MTGKYGEALLLDGGISEAQSSGTAGVGLDFGNCDWKVTAWLNTSSSGIVVTKMGFVGGSTQMDGE